MYSDITIAYHLGAPHTDKEQLTWSLRKNSALLRANGILLRRPKSYRKFLNEKMSDLQGRKASQEDQQRMFRGFLKGQEVNRLIFSNTSFLGAPSWMFYNAVFYQNAGRNVSRLRNLFPENRCELFLGVKNPVTFIPEVFSNLSSKNYKNFISGMNLQAIRWSDVIANIQQENPDCKITVWCNEDTPIIWPTVLKRITGFNDEVRLAGGLDIINTILSKEGAQRLEQYHESNQTFDEAQRQRINAIFMEKYLVDEEVEDEIDLPGWTFEAVEEMTENYEYDLELIAQMPGVNFIPA